MKRLLAASLTALVGVSAALTGATGASAAVPAPPQTLRVLTLGDSITEGAGSRTGVGYRLPLAQLAAGQARYGVDFVGSRQIGAMADPDTEGHSGYMIDDIRSGVDGWLATARPDVVLLHIGINDLNRGVDREHAKDRLAALVDRIFADRPGVTVVLQGLIPTTVNDTGLIPLYNEAAEQLARDRRAEGKKLGYVAAPELPMAELPDGLHPNDAGYAKLARNFYDRLDQAFTDGWTARPAAPRAGTESGANGRVRWADWDGDGRTDYVVVNDDGTVQAFLNRGGDGQGGWEPQGQVATGLTTDRSRVRFADFDGDGRADYLMINPNGSVQAYLNRGGDGHGGWEVRGQVAGGLTTDQSKVRFVDWDGDGQTDYLHFTDSGAVQLYLNRGGDNHGGWYAQGQVATGVTADRARVRFADFDGDGRADYELIGTDGAVQAFLNRGGDNHGGWSTGARIATGVTSDQTQVHFADFDGDGHADYLVTGTDGAADAYLWNGGDAGGGWTVRGRIATGA